MNRVRRSKFRFFRRIFRVYLDEKWYEWREKKISAIYVKRWGDISMPNNGIIS